MANIGQDWNVVVLKKNTAKKPKTATGLAKAIASGEVETVKRFEGGKNNSTAAPKASVTAAALEAETTDFKHVTVTHEFKIALMQARVAKKLSQADLAKLIQVKATVIQEYESGKAIPAPALISKFNRALGVQLPKIPKKKKVAEEDETKAPAKVKG